MVYERVGRFMRVKVREFMDEVMSMKMSPLLEQSLERFMTELLQIDAYSVNKLLGVSNPTRQKP